MNGPVQIPPRIGIVCAAFGMAGAVRPGEAVAGPVLIRLLADLGISGPAARSLLLRMRKEGWLSSERAGREARYRLAPVIIAAQDRLYGQLHGERPAWSGSFNGVLYTVPEHHRSFRDRLRRSAHLLGYATLHPGLLVAATDQYETLIALLPPNPTGSQVLRTRLTFSPEDTQRIVAQLWDPDTIAARYRAVLTDADNLTSRAQRNPPKDAAAFRAFAAATLPIYAAGAEDPDLPAELLPADWPGQQLGPALRRAFQVFGPLLGDYLTTVTTPRTGATPRERPARARAARGATLR